MKKIILRTVGKLIPRGLKTQLQNFKVLAIDFGQWQSIKKKIAIDKEGNPIPWYTYPAIEFIRQIDFSDKTIFEWGSGNSTIFWARRAKQIISIENNNTWFNRTSNNKSKNVKIILLGEKEQYINSITQLNRKFDVIIIDGKHRYECAKIASKYLKPNGFIILDNSDWFKNSCRVLRNSGLIQIDFCGFGPMVGFTTCTSFFLQRDFDFKRIRDTINLIGGIEEVGVEDI